MPVSACVRACMRVCVCVCARGGGGKCVHAPVRVCVHARASVCLPHPHNYDFFLVIGVLDWRRKDYETNTINPSSLFCSNLRK